MEIHKEDIVGSLVLTGGDSHWIKYYKKDGIVEAFSQGICGNDFQWNYANHVGQFAHSYIQETDFLDDPSKLEDLLLYCVQMGVRHIVIIFPSALGLDGEYGKKILKTNILARGTEPRIVDYILSNKLVTVDKIVQHLVDMYNIKHRC